MTIRILHLASFSGNIGDVANHEGFYSQFTPLFSEVLEVEKLEIRMFYRKWNEKKFDQEFADYVNTFDLFIIGGGNFFELCWDYSATGTTFDIQPETLLKISTPILINGIGLDDNKGITENNIRKFKMFLSTLFSKKNVFFSIRNDGSHKVMKKYFADFSDRIHKIPDHGFFLDQVECIKNYKPVSVNKNIGINLAMDMQEIRYKQLNSEDFLQYLAVQLNKFLAKTNYNIFMFAHIQSDYKIINQLIELLDDKYSRTRISIAPLLQGSELETFKYYKECEMIFGTRFHSNICAISMGIPTYGMITYPKHGYLYEEINLKDRMVIVNNHESLNCLSEEFDKISNSSEYIKILKIKYSEVLNRVNQEKEEKYIALKSWLDKYV